MVAKYGFVFLLTVLMCTALSAWAQEDKKDRKRNERRKDAKETTLKGQEFTVDDTAFFYDENEISFRNINKVGFYYNERQINLINKYQKEKQWDNLFRNLLNYTSRFGIENFIEPSGMDMMWQLARVSGQLGKTQIMREAFQLIIKHYRGDLKNAWRRYDSLSRFDKPRYVNLEQYYQMLELRKHIDTLRPPHGVLTNIGDAVNSKFEDYGVTVSRDSKTLIFTSKRNRTPGGNRLNQTYNEDLYMASRIGDDTTQWQEAFPFSDINSNYNEGSPCLSANGDYIIFSRCEAPDGKGNCDLYISRRVEGRYWSEPENLGIVNSTTWDSHPSLSITEDTLFFSSDRAGGFGGADLYFAVREPGGRWGAAQNLGPVINTQKNEVSPFIHHKYNVLYFSSDGQLVNYGDFDIFKSHNIRGRWGEPKNVGPLVNGKGREFYFAIDEQSDKLFFAKAENDNPRNLDIYSYPMPMEARPNAVVRFTGKVREVTTGEIFKGIVSVIDLSDGVEVMPRHLSEDGTFEFELINNKRYMLIVQGENFFRLEEVFLLQGDTDKNVAVKSIQNVRFESIEFAEGSAQILPGMENDLHLLINFLIDYPEFQLKISGHTDSSGDAINNLRLSQRRADAIKKYLVNYGQINPDRIKAMGYGSSKPIVSPEKTSEHKKINRRVEFKIYKNGELAEEAEGK